MWMRRRSALGAAVVAMLVGAAPAAAEQICFKPASPMSPDITDGVIELDNGWLNAFTYRGGDGTPDANIVVRASMSGSRLLLGVTAMNDRQYDEGDAVVLLYKVAGASSYGQLVISPLTNDSSAVVNPKPGLMAYMTSPDGSTWTPVGTAPAWLTWAADTDPDGTPCTATQPGTACRWHVEIGIDTTASGAPSAIDKLFVDVVEILERVTVPETGAECNGAADNDGDGMVNDGCPAVGAAETRPQCRNATDDDGDGAVNDGCSAIEAMSRQFSWPPNLTLVDVSDTTITPAPSTWGNVQIGGSSACTGVYFGYHDISAAPLNAGGHLVQGVLETFTVKLHNSALDAKGVRAHFSHAPFNSCGLVESCFQDMGTANTTVTCGNGGTPGNCCAGAADCIPNDEPGKAGTAMQVTWTPTTADEGHQCIRVRLEATVGGTTFINQGDFHNMWVDHTSKASAKVQINLERTGRPEGSPHARHRVRLTTTATTQYAFADGSVPEIEIGTLTKQIVRQYKPVRFTGKYVTVAGVRSAVWEPMSSFGFRFQHALDKDTQAQFLKKHARLLWGGDDVGRSLDIWPGSQDLETIHLANALLARESASDRPKVEEWTFDIEGGKPTGQDRRVVEVEVPFNGKLDLPIVATYNEGGTGPGPGPGPDCPDGGCCCRKGPQPATGTKTASLVLPVVVAGVILRRRRRR